MPNSTTDNQSAEFAQKFQFTITLPAAVTPEQAFSFAQSFGNIEDTETTTCIRENHHDTGNWKLDWYCVSRPDEHNIAARLALLSETHSDIAPIGWDITDIADENWLEICYKGFEPFTIGPFFIYGSHHQNITPPDGKITLQIDAATAFGSGEHGTTSGCLTALSDLKDDGFKPGHAIDMGTGSGILAIAAYKLWDIHVLAPDNDPEAVNVAHRHTVMNQTPEHAVECIVADSFTDPAIRERAPYPLVIANILAVVLRDMAHELCETVAEGGIVILSGILTEQAEGVVEAYGRHGMRLEKTYPIDEWVTLRLRKTA